MAKDKETNADIIKFYSVDQIAEMLKCNRDTVYRYINHGINTDHGLKLKATKIGRKQVISQEDFNQFLEELAKQ